MVVGGTWRLDPSFLGAGAMEERRGWPATERGPPQGGVISPLLANLDLGPLDQKMAGQGYEMVRYETTSSSSAAAAPKLKQPWPR